MRQSGLNRIHIGMESGSDQVLKIVRKGSSKKDHITAGLKVKKAGMELSEYVMPGLGGTELSREHALETADALNAINPEFIRLRSLAIPEHVELYRLYRSGSFTKPTDRETATEILLFLETLTGITSTLKSDHILNLFEEIQGKFPDDKEKMTSVIINFLQLDPHEQMLYQVGRRTGIFHYLADLNDPVRRAQVEETCTRFQVTPENVDDAIDELMRRFI
jgi:radical SAM superfamily enzyme